MKLLTISIGLSVGTRKGQILTASGLTLAGLLSWFFGERYGAAPGIALGALIALVVVIGVLLILIVIALVWMLLRLVAGCSRPNPKTTGGKE